MPPPLAVSGGIICQKCQKICRTIGGLKRHEAAKHGEDPRLTAPRPRVQRVYHPKLNGVLRCL